MSKAFQVSANKQAVTLLLAIVALCLFVWLPQSTFYSRGEPREALVMQDIVQSGNWILPRGYGEEVPSKPLFSHWIGAGISSFFGGVHAATARAPSALFSLLMVLFLAWIVGQKSSPSVGVLAGVSLFTSLEWYRASQTCRVDLVFSSCIALGMFSVFLWLAEEGKRRWYFVSVISLACAVLTKGPAGLAIPGLAYLCYWFFCRRWYVVGWGRFLRNGFLCFFPPLAIAFVWYALAAREGGDEFLQTVYYENVQRFLSTMPDKPHYHSVWYLYGRFFIGLLPWSLILPIVLFSRQSFRERIKATFSLRNSLEAYSVVVFFVVLAFFSIPSSKRSVYLLPAYPFVAVFIARWLSELSKEQSQVFRFFFQAMCALWSAFLLLLAGFPLLLQNLPLMSWREKDRALVSLLSEIRNGFFEQLWPLVLLLLPVAIGAALWRRTSRRRPLEAFLALLLGVFVAIRGGIYPGYTKSISPKVFAEKEIAHLAPAYPIFSFDNAFYGVSFYSQRTFFELEEAGFPEVSAFYVVAFSRKSERLRKYTPSEWSIEEVVRSSYGVRKPHERVSVFRLKKSPVGGSGDGERWDIQYGM